MAILNKSIVSYDKIGICCDWGIVYSLSAAIFVLPVSIAYLNSFIALAIFLYLLKKINRIILDWHLNIVHLNILGKIQFIWKGFGPPEHSLNRPLQILVLAMFLSVVFSQYPGLSLLAFFGKFLKCVFLYFCFIEAFREEKRIRIFLIIFLVSALITVLDGVIQYFTGKDFLKGHLLAGGRINSIFYTANGLGAYALPVIGLVIHFSYSTIVRNKSKVLGGALVLFLALLLTCLCWTYSRSSWVGYLTILFVAALLDRRKVLFLGALLLIFIFIFLPSLQSVRHMHLINDSGKVVAPLQQGPVHLLNYAQHVTSVIEQGCGSGRINFWKKAVSIIRESPVFGTGLNTYSRILKRDPDKATWWYAHNCYLQMTAETGLIGLASFLWMLFVLFRHGFNGCHQIKDLWPLTFLQGTIAGLSGFLVQSFFDNTFYTVQLGILMWFFIGLLVAVTRLNETTRRIVST